MGSAKAFLNAASRGSNEVGLVIVVHLEAVEVDGTNERRTNPNCDTTTWREPAKNGQETKETEPTKTKEETPDQPPNKTLTSECQFSSPDALPN